MKLILTTAAEKSGLDIDQLNIPATLVLSAKSPEQQSVLRKLKEGQKVYPYITIKGQLGDSAGVFKDDPIDYSSPDAFLSEATLQFKISKVAAKLSSKMTDQRDGLDKIRFSYLAPPYLEVSKVVELDPVEGQEPMMAIQGKMWRASDQRLDFLDPDDAGTPYGKGRLNVEDVYATFDGTYVYTRLSPYATQIKETVEEQKSTFLRLQSVLKEKANPDLVKRLNAAYKGTQALLKAHAGDLYEVDVNKGYLYYISSSGNWLMSYVPGLRKIDMHDRLRMVQFCKDKLGLDPLNSEDQLALRNEALSFGTLSMQDRFRMEKFVPILAPMLARTNKEDVDAYTEAQEKLKKLKPTDGPLGADDLPGLRAGVNFFPHQSLILASIKNSDRDLIDADPGAGKTLIVICDIIEKMKQGKCKKPLVLMPEPLLDTFAQEVREFSEFNVWIFNTEAMGGWKKGDFNQFIDDAKKAPPNTIFLTSYNWISLEVSRVESGELHASTEKNEYNIPAHEYGYYKTFPRAEALLSVLGIDALYEDECHIMKGSSNQAWAAAVLQRAPICRGLTGTIMPGNPIDITGPMSSIHSGVFGSKDDFLDEYTEEGDIHRYQDDAAKRIRAKIRNFGTLSVRRSAWAGLLPKSRVKYHYAEMTESQQKAYEAILTGIVDDIKKDPKLSKLFSAMNRPERLLDATSGDIKMGNLLSRFTPLDIFLNAPGEVRQFKGVLTGDDAIPPKAKAVADIIKEHLSNDRNGKVIVFVQFVDGAQNLMENMPEDIKAVSAFYQGGMMGPLNRLKNPDDPLKVLFAVDRTLRTGHNIQSVNCIIHTDITWMPGDMGQREGRAIRPKQTREVDVHYVIMNNSAELLKLARMISAEHIIAKANSNFEDTTNLEIREMSLDAMSTFRSQKDLEPYLKRRQEIQAHTEAEAITQQSFYGTKLLERRGYTSIATMLPDAARIHTPSAGNFDGRPSIVDRLIEETLKDMPTAPKKPRSAFKFHLQHSEPGKWSLVSYVGNDPKGYLRQFGFDLVRENLYLEVRNRAEVKKLLDKIEKEITISNRPELDKWIPQVRVTQPGVPHGQQKDALKDRRKLSAETKPEVEVHYATIDGAPMLYVDTLNEDIEEIAILKRLGFQERPAYWSLDVTRGKLITFFERMTSKHPDVKFGDWSKLKTQVATAFKANDLLDRFDQFAVKERVQDDLSA